VTGRSRLSFSGNDLCWVITIFVLVFGAFLFGCLVCFILGVSLLLGLFGLGFLLVILFLFTFFVFSQSAVSFGFWEDWIDEPACAFPFSFDVFVLLFVNFPDYGAFFANGKAFDGVALQTGSDCPTCTVRL